MNMAEFRGQVTKRMRGWVVTCVMSIAVIGLSMSMMAWETGTHLDGFIAGVQVGLFLTALLISIRELVKCRKALRSDDALDALYREETDERTRFIKDKMGGIGLDALIYILMVATVAAGFFDVTVFFTLLGVLACSAFLKAGLRAYFGTKY